MSARLGASRIAGLSVPQTASTSPQAANTATVARSDVALSSSAGGERPERRDGERDRRADALHASDQTVGGDGDAVPGDDRVGYRDTTAVGRMPATRT